MVEWAPLGFDASPPPAANSDMNAATTAHLSTLARIQHTKKKPLLAVGLERRRCCCKQLKEPLPQQATYALGNGGPHRLGGRPAGH